MPSKHSAVAGNKKESRLTQMQRKLNAKQRQLLNAFWQENQRTGKWPSTRIIHSRCGGKQEVKEQLQELGGHVVFETQDHSPGNRYELTIIGILLTDHGDKYVELLTKYLEFLREQYQTQPDRYDFTGKEVAAALKLSEFQHDLLGKFIQLGGLFNSYGGGGQSSWNIRIPDLVEDLPPSGPLDHALEDILFQRYQPTRAVFLEDRWKQQSLDSQSFVSPIPFLESDHVVHAAAPIDALKRRYQVFVSSTYDDLKEERQHVIQALLETKCIPTGMELFPAASVEQWELIKRVIQECDYYIVIVAGRYGSVNDAGISYTEMEFDFARKIGKPIIGFYHRTPKSLPGEKLEDSDQSKKRLAAFTEKVKQKLCRPWDSPAELGSAVKSAIFSELETNPRPGWIRADDAPASDAVERLKQRIVDLEEKLKLKMSSGRSILPEGDQPLEIPVVIAYDYIAKKSRVYEGLETRVPQQKIEKTITITWDEFIQLTSGHLKRGSELTDIANTIVSECCGRLHSFMAELTGAPNPEFDCTTSNEKIERILKTLMAKKLVKMRTGYVNWSDASWLFTPKGLQYLAELDAISR